MWSSSVLGLPQPLGVHARQHMNVRRAAVTRCVRATISGGNRLGGQTWSSSSLPPTRDGVGGGRTWSARSSTADMAPHAAACVCCTPDGGNVPAAPSSPAGWPIRSRSSNFPGGTSSVWQVVITGELVIAGLSSDGSSVQARCAVWARSAPCQGEVRQVSG